MAWDKSIVNKLLSLFLSSFFHFFSLKHEQPNSKMPESRRGSERHWVQAQICHTLSEALEQFTYPMETPIVLCAEQGNNGSQHMDCCED